jgi:hypothetical protein
MDKLEDYIRKNREELDKYHPSANVWQNIRKDLHGRRIDRLKWISAAAIIIILFCTTALLYIKQGNLDATGLRRDSSLLFMKANPQLMETERYYDNLVNTLYIEAEPLLSDYPDVQKELNLDLAQIDSLCADLRKDLKDNIANQEVIEALINNYRIKLRILEDMLEVLRQDENNQTNTNNHEL